MKTELLVALAAFAFILAGPVAAAGEHGHEHGAAAAQGLHLDAGRKWATDATLRQAMNEINQAMTKALPLIHRNRFGDADYQALAATVRQKLAYAVENCKLAPEADAMLHLVIADLMAAADLMEGKAAGSRHDGAVKTLQALKSYGRFFQHPNWKAAQA